MRGMIPCTMGVVFAFVSCSLDLSKESSRNKSNDVETQQNSRLAGEIVEDSIKDLDEKKKKDYTIKDEVRRDICGLSVD